MEELPLETTLYSLGERAPEPSERRNGDRHLTLFRVGSLMIGDRRELCLIKNISAGGMLVKAYCPIDPGTRVSVELKCGEPVIGTAKWNEKDNVGVTFDAPVDVVDLLATSMEGPRPRMPRVEVSCVAMVREGAQTLRVQVRDISQGGVKVATDRMLELGAEVIVTLPGLAPHPGTLRWHDSGCYGITFNKVVPLPQLVAWLHDQRERLRATG